MADGEIQSIGSFLTMAGCGVHERSIYILGRIKNEE